MDLGGELTSDGRSVPASATTAYVTPSGISCVSASSCVVAGSYRYGPAHATNGLIETGTLVAGTWTWVDVTAPTGGLSPAPNAGTLVTLAGVSCGERDLVRGNRVVPGRGQRNRRPGRARHPLGSTWTWTAGSLPTTGLAPAPAAVPSVTPAGVSCSSAASCVVTGSYRDAAGVDGLLEVGTLSGGSWSWVASTSPTGGLSPAASGGNEYLYGVSCTSAGTCVAAGSYGASGGGTYGLIESGSVGPGSVTATLTPSVPNPAAGGQFTLDLHVINTTADPQALALGTPTASPSTGVTITPPVRDDPDPGGRGVDRPDLPGRHRPARGRVADHAADGHGRHLLRLSPRWPRWRPRRRCPSPSW